MVAGPVERTTVGSVLFDLAVCGSVLVLALPYAHRGHLFFGILMAVALGWRRRWPLAVMLIVSGLALGHLVLLGQPDPTSFDVAVLIAMYSVVKYAPRLWHAAAAAGITAIGLTIEQWRHWNRQWFLSGVMLAGFCAAVWLIGYTLRTRRTYLRSVEERAATAERERDHLAQLAVAGERAAIARELHDVVAHSLAVMIVQADGGGYALATDPDQAGQALRTIAATGREALQDMHRIVAVLRGDSPSGAAATREVATVDQVGTLVERARSAGLRVTHECVGDRPAMSAAEQLTVFRVVQEALTNAIRHAGATAQVAIRLEFEPRQVAVRVVDDGAGRLAMVDGSVVDGSVVNGSVVVGSVVNGSMVNGSVGHGLVGMRERVAVHQGRFSAGPRLGGGWRVEATLPVKGAG